MSDTFKEGYVCLNNITFHAYHGVLPQERATGGDFVVSVKAGYPLGKAAESDDVKDTLNYAEMYSLVKEEMLTPSNLLENVAQRIAQSIFSHMPKVTSITVSVAKLNPPMSGDIGSASVEMRFSNTFTL